MKTFIKNNLKTIIIVILILLILLLIGILISSNNKNKEYKTLYESAQDSITITKNNKGELVTRVTILEASNANYILQLKTKDSSIIRLQNVILSAKKQHKDVELALMIQTEINQQLRDSLTKNNIIAQTTIHKGDTVYVYPTYERFYNDKWINDSITLGYNIFTRKLKVHDDFDFTVGTEPAGFLKRRNYAELTSKNPYSITKEMRVYEEKKTPNKEVKTGIISGIVGVIVGILIKIL
jgi:hypothetical protein